MGLQAKSVHMEWQRAHGFPTLRVATRMLQGTCVLRHKGIGGPPPFCAILREKQGVEPQPLKDTGPVPGYLTNYQHFLLYPLPFRHIIKALHNGQNERQNNSRI